MEAVDLGQIGLDFVQERLAWDKALSTELRQQPIGAGRVWTWLPRNTELRTLNLAQEPEWLTRPVKEDCDRRFTDFLHVWAKSQPPAVILVEDGMAKPGDAGLTRTDVPNIWASSGQAVYWLAGPGPAGISQVLKWGWGFFALFVLTVGPKDRELQPGKEISQGDITHLATATMHLAVPAFDFTSYVLWSRF